MSLFESRDQEVGFVREITSASKVTIIQRPSRLLQEGSGLVEGASLSIGEGTVFKLGDTLRQTLLCGFYLLTEIRRSGAVGGFERRKFDQRRLLWRRLRGRRFGSSSAPSRLLWPWRRQRGGWRGFARGFCLWLRRRRLFNDPRTGILCGRRRGRGRRRGNVHQTRATLPLGTPSKQEGHATCSPTPQFHAGITFYHCVVRVSNQTPTLPVPDEFSYSGVLSRPILY